MTEVGAFLGFLGSSRKVWDQGAHPAAAPGSWNGPGRAPSPAALPQTSHCGVYSQEEGI